MATSQEALAELQKYRSGMQTPEAAMAAARGKYGVDQAKETMTGLRGAIAQTSNLLKNIAPGVMGRTQGSLVSSAQANRMIQNEQAPVQQQLSEQGQNYNLASSDYTDSLAQSSQDANLALGSQKDQLSYLQGVYDNIFRAEESEKARQMELQRIEQQQRQFEAQMALDREKFNRQLAASNQGLGLGGLLGSLLGGGGGTGSKGSARNPVDIAFDMVKQFRQTGANKKGGWNAAANFLKKSGVDVGRGSAGDIALNRYFNAGGMAQYMNALRAEGRL